jgi:hypothetical protein
MSNVGKNVVKIAVSLLCSALVLIAPALAHETGSATDSGDYRRIVRRLVGGASLLYDMKRNRSTATLHERIHHFEEMVDERGADPAHLGRDWAGVRDAFRDARKSLSFNDRDRRLDFVISHLADDVAAGDRVFGRGGGGGWTEPSGAARHSFLTREACVGVNNVKPRPCPTPDDDLTFRIPPQVDVIRRISAQWRDYGRGAKAQVYVDGRLVWQTDVAKDWDADARDLDVRVRPGSKLTVRSANGDPIWIRALEVDFATD